jgi:pimeloyl-ACP methyl ester carboxylesterase
MRKTAALFAIAFVMFAATAHAQTPPPLAGDWDGGLKIPAGMELPLILHLTDKDGVLYSPDQSPKGVATTLSRTGDAVVVELPTIKGRLTATLSADGKNLTGTFAQGGATMPVHFARRAPGAAAPQRDRPQTPKPPFPYETQDVTFTGGGGAVLAGTLSRPKGAGPFPAVVMIAGSGPQARDENVEGHKIFLVIADRLNRAGIAVLRYDKRGVGESKGSYTTATTTDFTADAEAAVAWLRAQPGIAKGKLGLIGHSEGAEIAPVVAEHDPHIAFVVLLSTPAISGLETIVSQQRAIAEADGVPDATANAQSSLERRVLELVRQSLDEASAKAAVVKVLEQVGLSPAQAAVQAGQVSTPWFREFLNDDPASALARLRQPTLVVAGSKDLQVLPDMNLPVIRKALAGNRGAKIVELDGLNHLLQPAKTGAPSEYGTTSISVAPAALDLITDWVVQRAR